MRHHLSTRTDDVKGMGPLGHSKAAKNDVAGINISYWDDEVVLPWAESADFLAPYKDFFQQFHISPLTSI
jgi:hypothetical protein